MLAEIFGGPPEFLGDPKIFAPSARGTLASPGGPPNLNLGDRQAWRVDHLCYTQAASSCNLSPSVAVQIRYCLPGPFPNWPWSYADIFFLALRVTTK